MQLIYIQHNNGLFNANSSMVFMNLLSIFTFSNFSSKKRGACVHINSDYACKTTWGFLGAFLYT